jgi:adhesin/invasin
VAGSGNLTASATLSGGVKPTGSITFTLYTSDGAVAYTDTVAVSGDGTYSTAVGSSPGGFLTTKAGTYQWVASYGGDADNNRISSSQAAETVLPGVATQLAFIQGPVSTTKGTTLSTVKVQIEDQYGNAVALAGVRVTIALLSGSGLKGTLTETTDINGVATFSDLSISKAGTYQLVATAPHYPKATSKSFTIT